MSPETLNASSLSCVVTADAHSFRGLPRLGTFCVCAAMLFLAAAGSGASEEWAYKVYQPFDLPNGIVLSPVTYTGYYEAPREVEMTCWENRVWHHDPSSKGVVGKATQDNLAFAVGLKAS